MSARVSYVVRQRFHYEYAQPIRRLRHRLMVVPPDRHGDQRTVTSEVRASVPAEQRCWMDEHGNVCVEFAAPVVENRVEFEVRLVVSRAASAEPSLEARPPACPSPLGPTPLTAPAGSLAGAARRLAASGRRGLELAEAVNEWAHGALGYERGVTDVSTTAADALALGRGVCQDYAHVMLAVCRLLGLPARYVSGHVLGEGGTHAWVEVLLPDPAGSGRTAAFAFDPTYGVRAGSDYVTVATGRDYRDVAPTSGTYVGAAGGVLSASKRMDVMA